MAGFFGFFDYTKPGKGVYKNTPKKKGIALFVELFFRKFWKMVQLNMLYLLCMIPYIALMAFILIPFLYQTEYWIVYMPAIVCYVAIIGFAPLNVGIHYILRNFANENHAWIMSDFFEQVKKNFKQSIVVWIFDVAAIFLLYVNFQYYTSAANGSFLFQIAFGMMICVTLVYVIMHFYLYQIIVTFETKISDLFKNALRFTMMKLPQNIAILLVAVLVSYLSFYNLLVAVPMIFFISVSLISFIIIFYANSVVYKYAIKPFEVAEEQEEAILSDAGKDS